MPKERKDWVKVRLREGEVKLNDGRVRNVPGKVSVRFNRQEYVFVTGAEVEMTRADFNSDSMKSARGYLEISADSVVVPDKPSRKKDRAKGSENQEAAPEG